MKNLGAQIKEVKGDVKEVKHDLKGLAASKIEIELHDMSFVKKLLKDCDKNKRG